MWYIHCKDRREDGSPVDVVVGGFPTKDEARTHREFLDQRGDKDSGRLIGSIEALSLRRRGATLITPEQDKACFQE